jgi:hypothetical protein
MIQEKGKEGWLTVDLGEEKGEVGWLTVNISRS